MGKNRDKQRTKGNLKPSSSGRATALVTRDGSLGFMGFDGQGSASLGYVPMTTSPGDEVDSTVDGSFRMVLRKLTKRDSLTKYKALQEFSELCKCSKSEIVEGVLPFWPRIYNKLAMDTDQRVREATQEAMFQVVQRVGRNLAPHLKSVIGTWLCAQFDSYAPVASTAQRAFQAAFSEAKQVEALNFCKVGLCEFLEDNILRQTAETLSDPKIVSKEACESKYNRVVSSSILALGYLMTVSSEDVNSEMQSRYQEILEEKKLWKFARHTSPMVRSAVFSLVISSCMKIPTVVQSISSHVCPVVLSSLDESEPAVCHNLWGAVLFILRTIPDCWKQVNIRKAVLPKLWSVLHNGGYGCASVIYPSLLPFLSTLPQEVVGSGIEFHQNFFDNLQEGLQELRVQCSPSECAVVMATYMECLRYCLVHSTSQENAWSVKGYLIKDQLLPLIKKSLNPDNKIPTMHLYPAVSDLLNFLTSNITMEMRKGNDVAMEASSSQSVAMETSTSKDASKTITMECKQEAVANEELVVEEAEVMLEWFWQGFTFICLDALAKDDGKELDIQTVESLASCILGLISPSSIPKRQKKPKVAFCNTESESAATKPEVKSPQTSDIKVEDLYGGQLLDIACNICQLCLKEVRDKSCVHLKLLSTLLPHFVSIKLLQVLLEKEIENTGTFDELCEEFLASVVTPLMVEFGDQRQDLTCVISVLFGVLSCYTVQTQIDALNNMIEVNNSTDFLFALLQRGVDMSLPGMSAWLLSQSGSEKIQKLLRVAGCGDGDMNEDSFWEILQITVANTKNGPLVNKSCVDFIMESFVEMLRSKKVKCLPRILKIIHGYFDWCSKEPDDLSSSSEDILLALFLLQFSHPGCHDEVLETWQNGLQALHMQYCGCSVVLVRTSAIITEQLKAADSIDSLLSLSGSAVSLLHAATKITSGEGNVSTCYTNKIYHSLVPDITKCTEWRQKRSKGSWMGSPLCASMPVITQTPDIETVQDMLDTHYKTVAFAALITKTILAKSDGTLTDIVSDHVLVRLYLEIAWVSAWCMCVLGCRDVSSSKQLPSYFTQILPNTHQLFELMSQTLQEFLDILEKRQLIDMLSRETLTMAKTHGWLWTVVLTRLITQLNQKDFDVELSTILTQLQSAVFDHTTSSLVEPGEIREALVQSIAAIVPYIDSIYDVKVLTEHSNKYVEQDLMPQEFACVFPLIAAALSKWCELTNACEEAQMEYQLTLIETLDGLLEWKNRHDRMLLLNSSMTDVTAAEVTVNIAVIKIIELAIKDTAKMLTTNHWDFILCGLAGWLQTCEENFPSVSTSLLTNALCQQTSMLVAVVSRFFQDLPDKLLNEPSKETTEPSDDSETSSQDGYPQNLLSEWREFFSVNVFSTIISIFLQSSEMSSRSNLTLPFCTTCAGLGQALTYTPVMVLQGYEFAHAPDGDDTLPLWAQDVLFHALPLLGCNVHSSVQITAYLLISRILPELVFCHARKSNADEEESESERSPPTQLMRIIDNTLSHMVEILDDASVPFGTRLCLASDNESLGVSFELFMSCRLLISFFRQTNVEHRPEYATFLKKTKLVNNLMSVLFRLMPLDSSTVVTEDFDLSVSDDVTERLVQGLGRSLYYSVLHWMPAVVRQWFNGLEKKHAIIVDKYTSWSVTPSLCQHEMAQVKSSSLQFSNMQVKARPVAGEVAAVYTVDDLSMELVVKLANNHPLGVVTVDSGKKVGVTTSQWRSWILQMTTFLTHQNGSIMDGLVLWKRNADKHFEGVDDCMICFSVIHVSNYSLPKLSCKTCKKKFHSICLYRWFNTSNNSTCPLCRNIF